MQLKQKDIERFQTLHEKRFGVRLSKDAAQEQATKLLRVMQLTYRPMTFVDSARLKERQNLLVSALKSFDSEDLSPDIS